LHTAVDTPTDKLLKELSGGDWDLRTTSYMLNWRWQSPTVGYIHGIINVELGEDVKNLSRRTCISLYLYQALGESHKCLLSFLKMKSALIEPAPYSIGSECNQ